MRKNHLNVGEEHQKRVDELTGGPISLSNHRAVVDALLEKAVANGQMTTAATLLNIAQKQATADLQLRLRQGSVWTQERVVEFMGHVADAISAEAKLLPIDADAQADFLSSVAAKIDHFFKISKNSAEAIRLLEHKKE